MKWMLSEVGDSRTKIWFAFFPVTIGHERRWLEKVTILQEYKHIPYPHDDIHAFCFEERWTNVEFV